LGEENSICVKTLVVVLHIYSKLLILTKRELTNFYTIPQENADALAHEVSLAVYHLAGGKGAPPQPI